MQEDVILEIVPKNFILLCFAYNRIKIKDAVNFCQSFKQLFPQPNFAVIHVDGVHEAKLEGIARAITTLRFDFDETKFYQQLRIKTKTMRVLPKILTYYHLSSNNQKLFTEMGYYLCDFNSPDWKGQLENYAREFDQ
jgi:hypothetical protein